MITCSKPARLAIGLVSAQLGISASAQTLQTNWWVPNAPVNAVIKDDAHNTVIIGGEFGWLSPPKPFGMVTNGTTGAPEPTMQYPDGEVYEAVEDGNGGWFICGTFTHVGGQPRRYLARISANGSLHPWNPSPNALVYTIERVGGIVLAGGIFTQIGGAARSFLAALDGTTGLATSWAVSNSVFNSGSPYIWDLAQDVNTLYVVGEFWGAGSCYCNQHAIAIDVNSGIPLFWNPAPNARLNSVELDNGDVFLTGAFDSIGGVPRRTIARVNGFSGQLQSFDAGMNAFDEVQDVTLNGNTAYIAGTFQSVGGQSRLGFAAVDKYTGAVQSWDPQSGGYGYSLEVSGNNLLVGGNFSFIGGAPRSCAASLSLATGLATAWAPNVIGNVFAVAASAGRTFVGGTFTGRTSEGVQRSRLAALDATTGVPTTFNPTVSSTIYSLALSGNTLYVGGAGAMNISGQARVGAGAVDVTNGAVLPWNPNAPGFMFNMQVSGSTVYLGGGFPTVGGTARNRLAAVDATTAALLPWNPNANNGVRTMTLSGNTLYTGGDFTSVAGSTRNHAAAFDITTGNLLPWDPNVTGSSLYNISLGPSAAFLQGPFTAVGGQTRFELASVHPTTAAVNAWYPGSAASAMDALGSNVYVGGTFNTMAGVPRAGLACVDGTTGVANTWDPGSSPDISYEKRIKVIDAGSDAIRVAGDFGGVQGIGHPHFASFGNSIAPQLRVAVHAFLEGPFDSVSTLMNDVLRSTGVLPIIEPYSGSGFTHVLGGNEVCSATSLAVTGNNAIVDWVVLELRDAANPALRIETRSALIQRDGDVVATDGISPVGFTSSPGNYRVALRHRNHLGVMTASAVALSAVAVPIDFALGSTGTYGTAARKNVNGTRVLWAGNTVRDGLLKYVGLNNDRDPLLVSIGGTVPTNSVNGYYQEDLNLDGYVKYVGAGNDRDLILSNIGAVPTATRAEQLP